MTDSHQIRIVKGQMLFLLRSLIDTKFNLFMCVKITSYEQICDFHVLFVFKTHFTPNDLYYRGVQVIRTQVIRTGRVIRTAFWEKA